MLPSKITILAALMTLVLAGCASSNVPTPTPAFSANRAIDQDIAATHVVGPTTTSPARTETAPIPTAIAPWRNEELAKQPDN